MNLSPNLAPTKLHYHWHAPFSTGLLVANRLDHAPHLGSADMEGSGTLEGRHDQEQETGEESCFNQKLKEQLKILTDHDSTLFQANGITLKHDKKFHHDFNVEHIARIQATQLKVSRELENLEKKKETFNQIFKGLTGNYVSKKRKLKQNRRKSKGRKRKRFENNVRRVYHICVANPLAKELPNCLLYPPSMTIPEACTSVEDVATLLLTRDAAFIAHLLQSNYFSKAAGSRLITNIKPEVRNRMYCFLHPEDYSSNVGNTGRGRRKRRRRGRRERQRRRTGGRRGT